MMEKQSLEEKETSSFSKCVRKAEEKKNQK
jgi:hypothetical protein